MKSVFLWIPLLILGGGIYWYGLPKEHKLKKVNTWQQMTMSGKLSAAHSFLGNNCSECHTAVAGVKDSTCISCHANNDSLLQRQPTAFHVSIQNCVSCHLEHHGRSVSTTEMDHELLAKIGITALKEDKGTDPEYQIAGGDLLNYIRSMNKTSTSAFHAKNNMSAFEQVLNCSTCHSNEDPHRSYFGNDCTECHSTKAWTVPSYKHPSPSNTECAQCHAAPPSHYMMHFKMISAKVAGKPHANVNECFQCHETTSWNDIRDVGWYKHH